MVLRRTLPSRVMVDDSSATPVSASQNPANTNVSDGLSAEQRAREQAREATEAADAASRAAALAADLDDLPSGNQAQKLEESFAPVTSAPLDIAKGAETFQKREVAESFTPKTAVVTNVADPFNPAPVAAAPVAAPTSPLDIAKGIDAFQKREVSDSFTAKTATVTNVADPFNPAQAPASPASAPASPSAAQSMAQAVESFQKREINESFSTKAAAITNAADPFNPGAVSKAPNPFEAPAAAPAPVAAPVPEPVAAPAPQVTAQAEAAEPAAQADEPAEDAPAPDLTPSRPAQNNLKRRVREKTPRNFNFTPAATAPVAPAAPDLLPPAPAAAAFEASAEDNLAGPVAAGAVPETSFLPPLDEPVPVVAAPAPAQTFAVSEPAATWQPAPLEDGGVDGEAPQAPSAPAFVPTPAAAPALAPVGSLSNTAPQADTSSAPASDLPWVNASEGQPDDWQVETPATSESTNPFAAQEGPAPLDIYGGLSSGNAPTPTAGVPAYLNNNAGGAAPELPKSTNKSHRAAPSGNSNALQWVAGLVVLGVVGVGAYSLVQNDESQERVARLTGALTETTEKLPPELGGAQSNPGADVLAPEQVIAMGDMNNGILPPPPATGAENGTFQPLTPAASPSSSAMIDFADVPASEASQKIVGDSSAAMPEDLGLIAKFQQAVVDEKARQSGGTTPAPSTPTNTANLPASQEPPESPGLTPAEKEAKNLALQAKLENELAAYRETLASSETPAAAPKPSDFFKNPESFVNGTAAAKTGATTATLSPPVATTAEQAAQLAPNPNNLPLLPEPTAAQEPQVRQLSDFNVDVFEAQDDRVRIPKGIRPRFASTDFPEIEVLSFVPGRGVIAFNRGREGVLLIGESLEGWELLSVSVDKAEFRNGRSVQYVSAD